MSSLVAVKFRVTDLAKSADYYCKHFGMKAYGKSTFGYGGTYLQLESVPKTNLGTAFGHIAIASSDIYAMCNKVKEDGGNVTRQPGPVLGGTTEIAFVEAPEGFKFELIQRDASWSAPMLHVMLRVGDLHATRTFYEALGMRSLRQSENEAYKYTLEFVGYDAEERSTVFEFTYNWGKSADQYELGDAYSGTVLALADLEAARRNLQQLGVSACEITSDEFGRKIALNDPTGYSLVCYESSAAQKWIEAHL